MLQRAPALNIKVAICKRRWESRGGFVEGENPVVPKRPEESGALFKVGQTCADEEGVFQRGDGLANALDDATLAKICNDDKVLAAE